MQVSKVAKWSMLWLFVGLVALHAVTYVLTGSGDNLLKQKLMELPLLLQVHALGGALALVLGLIQFNALKNQLPTVSHRYIGRIYAVAVLASGMAGLAMAFRADGGIVAQLGFGLLALFWLGSMIGAWYFIRQKNIAAHRYLMFINYALTCASVTLRIELPLLGMLIGFELAYTLIAWLCWVPNLLFAIMWQRSKKMTASI